MKEKEEELKKKIEEEAMNSNNEEVVGLQEELQKQQEEAEKLRLEQEKKSKEFEQEKERALQVMEQRNKEQKIEELHLLTRQKLEEDLFRMTSRINEVNEICQSLGRHTYMYEPVIVTDLGPDGQPQPRVCCKAYPDRSKEFHNVLREDQFEDCYFRIMEKWESYQYDQDGRSNAFFSGELEPEADEAEVFGLEVKHEFQLIGNVYIFGDALAQMFETVRDESPILTPKGQTRGTLTYSIIPTMYD